MAYTRQSRTNPAGTQTGTQFADSILANDKALQDQILAGLGDGWGYAQSGGTAEEPTTITLTNTGNANIKFRASLTWSGGNVSGVTYALATDGATFDTIGSAGVLSYDGSGNLTSSTNWGGLLLKLFELRGKHKALKTAYDAHAAATGASVHGLGTLATQNANNISITGGTVNATPIGTTTPAEGFFTRAREMYHYYAPAVGETTTIDWTYGGSYIATPASGTNTLVFSNIPSSDIATHVIICANFSRTTFPATVNWGAGGKPSINGSAIAQIITLGGSGSVWGIVAWREV